MRSLLEEYALMEEGKPSVRVIKKYIRNSLKGMGWITAHHMWLNSPRSFTKGGVTRASIAAYANDMPGVERKRNSAGNDAYRLT